MLWHVYLVLSRYVVCIQVHFRIFLVTKPWEQYDLGPYCLQQRLPKNKGDKSRDWRKNSSQAWADPEWGDRGSGPPLKNHKNIGFHSITGPDPLKKPSQARGPMKVHF